MFHIDPLIGERVSAFAVSSTLGLLSYLLATFMARLISSDLQVRYRAKVLLIFIFVLAVWICYSGSYFFSGGREQWILYEARMQGKVLGFLTTPIWVIITIFKHPNKVDPKA